MFFLLKSEGTETEGDDKTLNLYEWSCNHNVAFRHLCSIVFDIFCTSEVLLYYIDISNGNVFVIELVHPLSSIAHYQLNNQ